MVLYLYGLVRVHNKNITGGTMLQNDMKKGQMGVLKNGWRFRIEDNKKGNIRLATVYGFATEMGSIYTHDIASLEVDGKSEPLEQTLAQQIKSAKIQTWMR